MTAKTSTSSNAAFTIGSVEDALAVGGRDNVKMRRLWRVRRDGTGSFSSQVSGR